MATVGVKTTAAAGRATGWDRIGFFPIVSSTPAGDMVGYNDRHLDFRTVNAP